MRFARFGEQGEERPGVILDDDVVLDITPLTRDIDGAFLSSGGVERVREAVRTGRLKPLATSGVRVGAPIARPFKILCVGRNYRDHAAETGAKVPSEPVLFMKATNAMAGPYDDLLIPRKSVKTDWEVELGVVIGAIARYLESPAAARACIAGYAVANDVSEREFQLEHSGQFVKGKSCETFNPLGPWLVPADEIADPQALSLSLHVNGVRRQNASTADMVFPVDYLIWYASQFMVLEPGDLLNTGTPAGVALGHPDKPFLRAGDVVEAEIGGLGRQRQVCRQA